MAKILDNFSRKVPIVCISDLRYVLHVSQDV